MLMEQISARFDQLIKERGIKVFDVARQCPNLSIQTVYNLANGDKNTTVETLGIVCKGLGVSLKDFFDWDADDHYTLSNDEKLLIEYYRRMDDIEKARASGYYKAIIDAKE